MEKEAGSEEAQGYHQPQQQQQQKQYYYVGEGTSPQGPNQATQPSAPPYYGTFQGNPGYPQPAQPDISYPQQQYGYQAVPGYPVIERRSEAELPRLPCCGLGIGWCLFIMGWFLAFIPWYAGAVILVCTSPDPRERVGLVCCTIAVKGAAAQPIPILPPPSLPDPPASPAITPSTSHPVPPIQPPDVSPDHALSDSDSDLDVADATPEVDAAPPRQEKRIPGWLYSTAANAASKARMSSQFDVLQQQIGTIQV
ncbi:hypothetical protein L7F22_028075 [Adiantum nelumboides]|nr:hypothetical protein [Adiantum nelumboides]